MHSTLTCIADQTGCACGTVGHQPHALALSLGHALSLALAVAVANGVGGSGGGRVLERGEPWPFVGTAGSVVPV